MPVRFVASLYVFVLIMMEIVLRTLVLINVPLVVNVDPHHFRPLPEGRSPALFIWFPGPG